LANSVFPTPLDPTKIKEPTGELGEDKLALAL